MDKQFTQNQSNKLIKLEFACKDKPSISETYIRVIIQMRNKI